MIQFINLPCVAQLASHSATSPTGGQCLRRNTTGHRWTSSSMSVRTIAVNQCWVDSLGKWMSKKTGDFRFGKSFPEKIFAYPRAVLLSVCLCVSCFFLFATRHDIYSLSPRASPCRELTLTAKMEKNGGSSWWRENRAMTLWVYGEM